MEDLRKNIDVFADNTKNLKWIKSVGKDILAKCDLDAETYIADIVQGSRPFDELAIVLACASHNIHCCILLDGDYWTTRACNEHRDCPIRLAYVGQGCFKDIVPLQDAAESDDADDLEGAGLLEQEDKSDADGGDNQSDAGFDDEYYTSSEEDLDNDDSRAHDFDSEGLSPKSNGSAEDSQKSIVQDQPSQSASASPEHTRSMDTDETVENKTDTSASHIDLTSKDDAGYDSDLMITAVSIPKQVDPTIKGKVHRSREYNCYICHFKSQMQITFVKHFEKEHDGEKYHCDFGAASFDSCNGLFKHERSHQYLQYECKLCGHKTQFPYQMKAHRRTHTRTGLEKCEKCDKHFASVSSRNTHQKMHSTSIKCTLCPQDTKKVYTSKNAYNLHFRGEHGKGWTGPCGKHFKWKSQHTQHTKYDCRTCIDAIKQQKIARFHFLHKTKQEQKET